MKAASAAVSLEKSRDYRAILWGGLAAGVLDLAAAFVNSGLRGRGPVLVMHSIASGLLGAKAYQSGAGAAALGVALHFLIAFGATAVYYAASRKLDFLVRQAIVCGALYGIAVYWFMNLVVLPLSAVPFKVSYTATALITGMGIHIFCVGLPIALVVRRYSKTNSSQLNTSQRR
jgi:hypothetical protein